MCVREPEGVHLRRVLFTHERYFCAERKMAEIITEIMYSILWPASSSRLLSRQPMMHVISSALKVVKSLSSSYFWYSCASGEIQIYGVETLLTR